MSGALARRYEFDDQPDRRKFLDQLLSFMEEEDSPITTCPSISKNPLDLFRLYLLVRDRNGFLEVTRTDTNAHIHRLIWTCIHWSEQQARGTESTSTGYCDIFTRRRLPPSPNSN